MLVFLHQSVSLIEWSCVFHLIQVPQCHLKTEIDVGNSGTDECVIFDCCMNSPAV